MVVEQVVGRVDILVDKTVAVVEQDTVLYNTLFIISL